MNFVPQHQEVCHADFLLVEPMNPNSDDIETPLNDFELERRAAALSADRAVLQFPALFKPIEFSDKGGPEGNDEREFGPRTAKMLSECRRDVALALPDTKVVVFQASVKRMSEAVRGRWLSKAAMMDRLLDIAESHDSFGLDADGLQRLIGESADMTGIAEIRPAAPPSKRRLIAHRASDLKPEKLIWVWPGRMAEGKLMLLGGPPGLGKSQLTAFMAAIVSTGGNWPGNEGATAVGSVIFMSAEDGIEDTIVPRLMAAGAALDRVYIVASAMRPDPTKPDGMGRKTFSLKTDVDLLEAKAKEIGDVRLIVVDPISAYMGGSDGNSNVETREVLEPLSEMANRLRISVVAVTHLNKGGGGGNQNAVQRFHGSIAFIAAARSAFAVLEDPDNPERRFFLEAKNNLAKKNKGLVFRTEQREVAEGIVSSNVIFFDNEHVSQSIDEALTASENRGGSSRMQNSSKGEIAEFLNDVLAGSPVDVLEVDIMARNAGLLGDNKSMRDSKAFREVRDDLGVVSTRVGFGPGARYLLTLPKTACAPNMAMGAPSGEGARMNN